jgi:hypothetical protein
MQQLKKALYSLLFIIAFTSLSAAIATTTNHITTNASIGLGYCNGSYANLPAGSYWSLQRINGIWYVNGEQFPSPNIGPVQADPLTEAAVNVFATLLIIAIPAAVFWYLMGEWGAFIGANVGAILCYLIRPAAMPLWGLILLGVLDALIVFAKVTLSKRGG